MSRSVSALSSLLPIPLWERTVFVKCNPSPASFTERRAVLRALQKHTSEGIEVFKKLKVSHEPANPQNFTVANSIKALLPTMLPNALLAGGRGERGRALGRSVKQR